MIMHRLNERCRVLETESTVDIEFDTLLDLGGGSQEGAFDRIIQDADPEISDILIERINNNNIRDNLRDLTKKPHIAGEQADFDLVTYLKDKLTGYGLDSVRVAPYQVLLSYPNGSDPNRAQLLNVTSGDVIFDSTTAESNISHLPGVIRPFLAYAPADDVEGELVYVNYGRVEDYDYLEHNYNVNVTEKIVIARYGRIFRGSKVDIAARHGAIGIIIYSDPADYTDPDDDRVFPDTVWLPGTAAQRGTTYTGDGDPLTPGYPAIRTAYRWPENETENPLPAIPAHCMGYDGAKPFLEALGGQVAPQDWTGRIKGLSYRIGPSVAKIRLSTHTYNSVRKAETVIAIVRGAVEPDRYVLMGNHRDAWVYGSIDPSSGTAVMMEVARVMAQLAKEGRWRPRRSIMFCSWGAEEYGLLGSTEIAEQYVKSLGARAVAYANIDIAVQGNYSLRALGTPLLYRSIFEAAKKVPNPNPDEVAANRRTVYDTWRASFPWEGQDLPRVGALGSGSDYAPMLQIVGITSVDFRYTYDSNKYKLGSYPLYHTEYETFKTMQGYLDRDFEYHRAVARVGAELVRSLADSLIIPFNVSDYAWGLELMEEQLDKEFGDMLRGNLSDYSNLAVAIKSFADDVKNFEMSAANINKKDPMAIRMVNDQLLLLEKAFLDPSGLPSRPLKKHLLFAENSNDIYAGSSFPGLVDLLFEIDLLEEPERSERWRKVEHHFSVLLNAIQSAGYTLRDVVNFVEETY
nr:hypothetical protein BaRGS_035048 [Batillaria attramentaria]